MPAPRPSIEYMNMDASVRLPINIHLLMIAGYKKTIRFVKRNRIRGKKNDPNQSVQDEEGEKKYGPEN